MTRVRSLLALAGIVLISATVALATAHSASASTGSPGDVRYTTVSAYGGLGGALTLNSGFSVYRSPAAPSAVQDITLQFNVWKWNGSSWGSRPYDTRRYTIRTYPGQYAPFPALSVPLYGNGTRQYYTVTTDETWAYTNGTVIGTAGLVYNAMSDYQCLTRGGECAEHEGWVELLIYSP